jgi:hypothetical protein
MLLVNGYTGIVAQKLRLAPQGGRLYWPKNILYPGKLLNDLNLCYIHPCTSALSSAKGRFQDGYEFAFKNEHSLMDHILVTGNDLKIIAHSQGVAFAEGIAAYLFEEKNYQTSLLIALNGEQMATTPQSRCAISTRIVFRTTGDKVTNKFNQTLRIRNLSILESKLKSGFIKYAFYKSVNESFADSSLYFRGSYGLMNAHIAHSHRPSLLWRAVRHALLLLNEEQAVQDSDYYRVHMSNKRQPFSQN